MYLQHQFAWRYEMSCRQLHLRRWFPICLHESPSTFLCHTMCHLRSSMYALVCLGSQDTLESNMYNFNFCGDGLFMCKCQFQGLLKSQYRNFHILCPFWGNEKLKIDTCTQGEYSRLKYIDYQGQQWDKMYQPRPRAQAPSVFLLCKRVPAAIFNVNQERVTVNNKPESVRALTWMWQPVILNFFFTTT